MPITVTGGATIAGGLSTLDSPALSLDFMSGTLDSRITFSRGTQGTITDSTGRSTYAPNNICTYSEFQNGVTDAQIRGGLLTATTFTGLTAGTGLAFGYDGTTGTYAYMSGLAAIGYTYIFSAYVRMDDGGAPSFGSSTTASPLNSFAIVVGGSSSSPLTYINQSLGGGLYRVSGIRTVTSMSVNTTGIVKYNTNDNRTFKVSGYQLELVTYQTSPSTYVATAASAYYGPRFDYDPISLQSEGLLIEEARTNLLTYSGDQSQAQYGFAGGNKVRDVLAPDGTISGTRFYGPSTGTAAINLPSIATSTTMTYSIYTKYISGQTTRAFLMRNGTLTTNFTTGVFDYSTGQFTVGNTGWTAQSVGNGWYRLSYTNSATQTINVGDTLTLYFGATGAQLTYNGEWAIWGAQLEAGAFATSYIPTAASTATRNADAATITGTNFTNWYNGSEGTISMSLAILAFGSNRYYLAGDATQRLGYGTSSGLSGIFDGVTAVAGGAAQAGAVPFKLTTAYDQTGLAATLNGGTVSTAVSSSGSFTTMSGMGILCLANGTNVASGYMRSIEYYNSRLTNDQLQSISRL